MSDEPSAPSPAAPLDALEAETARPRRKALERVADIGASGQAAIPGLYAWAITVMPVAWSDGAPFVAKASASLGVVALVGVPLASGTGRRGAWTRASSVWGFVLSSALVWALAPSALGAARLDGVRGTFGVIGWALFAFASAGPVLRSDPTAAGRIVATTSRKPRRELPRGDAIYIGAGVVLALAMQAVGWGIAVPERAVLVRLVTLACGIAVLGAMTHISLVRHAQRSRAPSRVRLKRALPWLAMLALVTMGAVGLAGLR